MRFAIPLARNYKSAVFYLSNALVVCGNAKAFLEDYYPKVKDKVDMLINAIPLAQEVTHFCAFRAEV